MKLIYLTSLFYPSTVANNRQTLSMAKELSDLLGRDFTFVISHTRNRNLLEGINYYEMKVNVLRKLHLVSSYYFLWLPLFALKLRGESTVFYFKDSILASIAIFWRKLLRFNYKIAFEPHLIYSSWHDSHIFKNADFILPITHGLRNIIIQKFKIPENKILVVPDGVDLKLFDIPEEKERYRKELNLPADKKIIGYVGTFSTMGFGKGVKDLILAFAAVKKERKDVFLTLAGGRGETGLYIKFAVDSGLVGGEDFIIEKYIDYPLVPKYLKSCDILVSPFPLTKHFAYYMSPLKIFEYMASKRPIITSDLPSIREVITEKEAVFFEPGNIKELSEKIALVLNNLGGYRPLLAEAAFEKVKNYTWHSRAKNILEFMK